MGRNLKGVSLARLLLRRLDRHARAKVDPPVRRFVLGLQPMETTKTSQNQVFGYERTKRTNTTNNTGNNQHATRQFKETKNALYAPSWYRVGVVVGSVGWGARCKWAQGVLWATWFARVSHECQITGIIVYLVSCYHYFSVSVDCLQTRKICAVSCKRQYRARLFYVFCMCRCILVEPLRLQQRSSRDVAINTWLKGELMEVASRCLATFLSH